MSSVLTDFLKTEATHIRDESSRRKADKLDWQRASREIIDQMSQWLKLADMESVLRIERTSQRFEDYDLGVQHLDGLSLTLGSATVRVSPSHLDIVGEIQLPGETQRHRLAGRMTFDNGTDRIPLYRVKDGDRDVWLWWSQGGTGKPFDRESFEATVVSLLR